MGNKKAFHLLWKYPSIWVLSILMFYLPVGNIITYSVKVFFEVKKGNNLDYEVFLNKMYDMGAMDIIFELSFIIVIFIFSRYVDKYSYRELGLTFNIKSVINFFFGIIIAAFFITIPFIIMLIFNVIEIEGTYSRILNGNERYIDFAVFQMISLFLVAFQEELLHRAYLINIMRKFKPFPAIFIPSVIFSGVHVFNVGMEAFVKNPLVTAVGLVNILIIGLLYSYYYYNTGDLWLVIGSHFSWNFMMGPVYGFQISGLPGKGFLQIKENGFGILSGGIFGPEGGLLVTLSLVVMFFMIKKYVEFSTKKIQ